MLAAADYPTETAAFYRQVVEEAQAEKKRPKSPMAGLIQNLMRGLSG